MGRGNPHPVNAGKGRKKGVPNKFGKALKDMILESLAELGGTAFLVKQGTSNPTAYLALVGRVLPLQVKQGGADPVMPKGVVHEHHDS